MTLTYEVFHDDWAESPREWDNLGEIVHWHRDYNLGEHNVNRHDYASASEVLQEFCVNEHGASVFVPLYLYDHSGITVNTTGFSCPWDSGQVGWIFATPEKIEQWLGYSGGCDDLTNEQREQVVEILRKEVAAFDTWLTGDVWGYAVRCGDQVLDSCCGFYGADYAEDEAKDAVEFYRKQRMDAVVDIERVLPEGVFVP